MSNNCNENKNIDEMKISVHNAYDFIRHKFETQRGNFTFEVFYFTQISEKTY